MSGANSNSNLGRQYLILLLFVGCCAVGLAISFWRTGMLTIGSPPKQSPSTSIPEASWDEQISAVQRGEGDRIEITQTVIGDEHLQQLNELTALRELILDKSNVTDAGLAPLKKLPNLDHLRLRGAKITDQGFHDICQLSSLKRLNLPQADLTDAGLAELPALDKLELLRLGSPRVTNAGIEKIAAVKSIRWLHLIDIPVTDPALKSIAELPNLESLYLDGARISDDAYEQFFRVQPGLHLHIDQKHHDRDPHKAGHTH